MGNTKSKEYLFSAIECGDQLKIKEILKLYPSFVNEPMTKDCKNTPLCRAVWRGDLETVNTLLSMGADVNLAGPKGKTPLMWACIRNRILVIKELLVRGVDADAECPEGLNALDYTILFGNYDAALLIKDQTLLKPKEEEIYATVAKRNNLIFVNYKIFIHHMMLGVNKSEVPDYLKRPDTSVKLIDPVIDPRETWGEFLKRMSEFGEPPLIERDELPAEMQPQNRFWGKVRSYVNGKSPYPKDWNKTESHLALKESRGDISIDNIKTEKEDRSDINLSKN